MAGLYDAPLGPPMMPADPYDDDDDQPTLQRPSPASASMRTVSAHETPDSDVPARFNSGIRAAFTPPASFEDAMEEELSSDYLVEEMPIFPPEDDTAVDRHLLPAIPPIPQALVPTEEVQTVTVTGEDLERALRAATDAASESPADLEKDTVLLPVDVAALLQLQSRRDDDDT